ncbi:MAG TPA: ferredoxin [Myxococcota bacterium]|nr:ferredoxin [Myxococcota bacterium]
MRIRVDLDLCQGHGTCAEEAPEVFAVDERESKVIVRDECPAESLRAKVKSAVRFCPTRALSLVEE